MSETKQGYSDCVADRCIACGKESDFYVSPSHLFVNPSDGNPGGWLCEPCGSISALNKELAAKQENQNIPSKAKIGQPRTVMIHPVQHDDPLVKQGTSNTGEISSGSVKSSSVPHISNPTAMSGSFSSKNVTVMAQQAKHHSAQTRQNYVIVPAPLDTRTNARSIPSQLSLLKPGQAVSTEQIDKNSSPAMFANYASDPLNEERASEQETETEPSVIRAMKRGISVFKPRFSAYKAADLQQKSNASDMSSKTASHCSKSTTKPGSFQKQNVILWPSAAQFPGAYNPQSYVLLPGQSMLRTTIPATAPQQPSSSNSRQPTLSGQIGNHSDVSSFDHHASKSSELTTSSAVPVMTVMNKNINTTSNLVATSTSPQVAQQQATDTYYYIKDKDGKMWLLNGNHPVVLGAKAGKSHSKDHVSVGGMQAPVDKLMSLSNSHSLSCDEKDIQDEIKEEEHSADVNAVRDEHTSTTADELSSTKKPHRPAILARRGPKKCSAETPPEEPPPSKRRYIRRKQVSKEDPSFSQQPGGSTPVNSGVRSVLSNASKKLTGRSSMEENNKNVSNSSSHVKTPESAVTVKMECTDEECVSSPRQTNRNDLSTVKPKFRWSKKGKKLRWSKKPCQFCSTPRVRYTAVAAALKMLVTGKYRTGLKLLVKSSRVARKAVAFVAGLIAADESKLVCDSEHVIRGLSDDLSYENIMTFSWERVKEDLERKMPLTTRVMIAVMMRSYPRISEAPMRLHSAPLQHVRRCAQLVMTFAILQQTIEYNGGIPGFSCKAYTFLRNLITVMLVMKETNYKIMNCLGYLGVCLPKKKSAPPVKEFLTGFSDRLCLSKVEQEMTTIPAFDAAVCPTGTNHCPVLPVANYSLCFENLQPIISLARIRERGLQPYIALPFAVVHRVTTDTFAYVEKDVKPAIILPASTFLPVQKDYTDLRKYMVEVVKMILVEQVPCLQSLQPLLAKEHRKKGSIRHHKFSHVMPQESEFLSMTSITGSAADIDKPHVDKVLKELRTYVPSDGTRHMPVVVHSDLDTLDLMVDATDVDHVKEDMNGCGSLLEVGPEFRKETSLMQDIIECLHNPGREHKWKRCKAHHGTLLQIRDLFFGATHINPTHVSPNFRHSWSLLKLTTEGLTLLLAMKYAGMATLEAVPTEFPEDKSTQLMWLTTLAMNIVDRVWKQPSDEELHRAYNSCEMEDELKESFQYCCKKDIGGEMLRCYNINCPKGYIHRACMNEDPSATDEWYCSEECEDSGDYIYCSCRRWKEEDMVQCQRKRSCCRAEWYHFSCANPLANSADDFPEEWYCSEECTLDEQDDDEVLEYSMSLLWHGLNLLVRRDIVREGNGPMMLQMWKIDMLQFWENNHNKLLRLGHRLLAYTGGFMPEYVAHDITWNRVANPTGERGDNFALDQIVDAKSACIKDILKNCEKFNKTYLEHNCMMGCAAQEIHSHIQRIFVNTPESLVTNNFVELMTDDSPAPDKFKAHLETFIIEYKDDALLDYCPPREIPPFPNFKHKAHLRDPHGLGRSVREMSRRLDTMTGKYQDLQNKLRQRQTENGAGAGVEVKDKHMGPKTGPNTSTHASDEIAELPPVSSLDKDSRDACSMDSELATMESLDGVQLFQID